MKTATRKCRLCEGKKFADILDMGKNPLVNSLIEHKDLGKKEEVFPLKVVRCEACGFIQVEKPIDARKIYKEVDYLYYSSDMPGLDKYFREYAEELFPFVEENELVVEIGSNDGIMLRPFAEHGNAVLGVDPATNVAVRAMAKGIPTLPLFFTERLAKTIAKEMGPAKVIYANNCIAHIDDLGDVLKGVQALLQDDGIFVVECNYWGGMVKNKNYSLVYHDHFSYFSLQNWEQYAEKFGMKVFDATVTPAQGGSLRVFMTKDLTLPNTPRYLTLRAEEHESKVNTKEVATQWGKDCVEEAKKLFALVAGLVKEGKRIAGYGAAAKGFSILKLAGIDQRHIDYFVDDSAAKQDKFTPVSHIPVLNRFNERFSDPDYFFITAPNYADVIMAKEKSFMEKGGKFILSDSTIVG